MEVDPLVALQPDQPRAGGGRERPRDLRLADARLALEQQRLLERDRQVDRGGEAPVGEVALPDQRLLDVADRREAHAAAAASSSARRQSTRARWRL